MYERKHNPELDPARSREQKNESTTGEKLCAELLEVGVNTTRVEIPGGTVFSEALLFPTSQQVEPMVRVYRGINRLDATVLQQVSYALRSRREEHDRDLVILEHAREAVERLAHQPTHQHLLEYIEAIWPDLNDKEIRELDQALIRLEDNILEHGWSVRLELTHNTYGFTGSYYADVGLTPYLSGSTDCGTAAGYGRGAIMVIDLPVSRVEALATSSSGETAIKTAINPIDIVAILIRDKNIPHLSHEQAVDHLEKALRFIEPQTDHEPLVGDELDQHMKDIRKREAQFDAIHHEQDIRSIQERRAGRIMRIMKESFEDEEILRVMKNDGLDRYSAVKQLIYDRIVDRFIKAGGQREGLTEHFEYDRVLGDDHRYISLHCDRRSITDKMLIEMKRRLEREEELNR